MNDLQRLLAIEAIKNLKARYFRSVDTKDWDGFKAVFAPDALFDISQDVPGCILVGPEKRQP
jgi:SnoaL-like domain